MSRRRTTFGKLQRDRDKQAKQQAKVERRQQRSQADAEPDEPASAEVDQASVLAQLAKLHEDYDDGRIDLDDFEARRAELTSLLQVD